MTSNGNYEKRWKIIDGDRYLVKAGGKMIIWDFILANKDRHFNNFGVIRNVLTLEFEKVAPIFDNGCSLCFDENDMYVGEFFLTKPFEEYE